ncbi:hypothetical protein [Adlercreutzia caecimuris]|uniref:Dynamin family protein n=1 Tax=Adlercreutzia caecimuris TaxID=671266 RepID=A0A4S4G0E2_9ACTN|nr:hypothetical protein [Adlercreutzia caecimuris]THG35952.1 hypothetical protein E5986_10625 [Adlercreutzia caecimuris]
MQEQYAHVRERAARVQGVIKRIDELLSFSNKIDEEVIVELIDRKAQLNSVLADYERIVSELQDLEGRFSRETINIGVSGQARVGKSTTLQSFSGLSDDQIPTGCGLPVTAVRSEIYNSKDNYALIEFRDEDSFIREYITPLVDNVNGGSDQALSIDSIAQLRTVSLPEALGDNIGSIASKSLASLKEAQASLETFVHLLTGRTEKKDIADIRKFVAYPTDEEKFSGNLVDRSYLAVNGIKIFCNFPSIDGEKIGIIDLPGLGELGKSAESIHTRGLENSVDQILLIMYPTSSSGYASTSITANVDQLRSVQPGISRRSDLIVAAINNDDTNSETAKTLRRDFESAVNNSQETDKIKVEDYCAVDEQSVRSLFHLLLDKLASSLPTMDSDAYSYVMDKGLGGIDGECSLLLDEVTQLANKIMKTIPLEDSYLDEKADELSKTLIYEFSEIEERRFANVGSKNPLRSKLKQQVTAIYDDNERRIDQGLFLGGESSWLRHAKGQSDYVNFFRNEAKRVRAEIVDSYRDVDVFYDYAIQELKDEVLSAFYSNTGRLYAKIGVDPEEATSLEDIARLIDELDAITRNEDFTHCFRFISDVSFKFSQNVFYNIYTSLEELHNPDANQELGGRGKSGEQKIEMAEKDLKRMAHEGNAEIRKRILEYNDSFNEFLYTCMTFFNDFLFRKDARTYERCVRALLKACREYVISDEEYKVDKELQTATKRLKDALSNKGYNSVQSKDERAAAIPARLHDGTSADEGKQPAASNAQRSNSDASENASSRRGEGANRNNSGYVGSYDQEW